MNRVKIVRKTKSSLILLFILMILISNFTIFNNKDYYFEDSRATDQDQLIDEPKFDEDEKIRSSNYASEINYNTCNLNISLHQAYHNNTYNIFLNTSDINNNTFSIPHPSDNSFNSSFTDITITNIYAPNKTLVIDNFPSPTSFNLTNTNATATSFKLLGSGNLQNVSLRINNTQDSPGKIKIVLYNSTWNSEKSINEPYGNNFEYFKILNISTIPENFNDWWTIRNITFLDSSFTANNTWFVGVFDISKEVGNIDWFYTLDEGKNSDGVDQSLSLIRNYSKWDIIKNASGTSVDFQCIINLSPINNTANPIDIGMDINGSLFELFYSKNGTGSWISLQDVSSLSEEIKFQISANWWDVICKIESVMINFTKTNLNASSNFNLKRNQANVLWNVTINEEINQFEDIFVDFSINFTIPMSWILESIEVWNATDNKTSECEISRLNTQFRYVRVLNAGNGTNWYLLANSSNLLSLKESITAHVNGNIIQNASLSYNVQFNSTFNQKIFEDVNEYDIENISFYIYNPDVYNNRLNFSSIKKKHISGNEFYLAEWNITKYNTTNIEENLDFKVQIIWFNTSAAGFAEKNFTIIAEENRTQLSDFIKFFNVRRGVKIKFEFNYTTLPLSLKLSDAFLLENYLHPAYDYNFTQNFNSNYEIEINTSEVDITYNIHYINFTIGKIGFEPQPINLQVDLKSSNASIESLEFDTELLRSAYQNLTVSFYFNDTINNEPILNLNTSNIKIYDVNGTLWGRIAGDHNWTLYNNNAFPGYYKLNISLKGLDSGNYKLKIEILNNPNYELTYVEIEFTLKGNRTLIGVLRFIDPLGRMYPDQDYNYYISYVGGDILLQFILIDTNFNNDLVLDKKKQSDLTIEYQSLLNTNIKGFLKKNITYSTELELFEGLIMTSALDIGTYIITLSIELKNYDVKPFIFTLKVQKKLVSKISEIICPNLIIAGESRRINIKVEFFNGSSWVEINDALVILNVVLYFNDEVVNDTIYEKTNEYGIAGFIIFFPLDTIDFSYSIRLDQGYYYIGATSETIEANFFSINEFYLFFSIICNLLIGLALSGISIYNKIVVSKKNKMHNIYKKWKFIFEDLITLKRIIIFDNKKKKPILTKVINKIEISSNRIKKIINSNQITQKELKKINIINQDMNYLIYYETPSIMIILLKEKKPSKYILELFEDFCSTINKIDYHLLNERKLDNLINEKFKLTYLFPHILNFNLKNDIKSFNDKISKEIINCIHSIIRSSNSESFLFRDLINHIIKETEIDIKDILSKIEKLRLAKILIPL